MPSISISGFYKSIIRSSSDAEAKDYVSDKIRQAEWIMKCISKRSSTLKNTVETIVSIQKSFSKTAAEILNLCALTMLHLP